MRGLPHSLQSVEGSTFVCRTRCYTAAVQEGVWAKLTVPFPAEALIWSVAEVERSGERALLEPAWSPQEVRGRLDAELGLAGWSYSLSAAGEMGVLCTLTIGNATRAAAASNPGAGVPLEDVAELAFTRAARQFGLAPDYLSTHDSYWVDYDPEAAQPLYDPDGVEAPAATNSAGTAVQGTGAKAPEAAAQQASNELLAMIERLVDRLRGAGLGKEAAQLVARHHGGSAEQSRELYARLRELLLGAGGEGQA